MKQTETFEIEGAVAEKLIELENENEKLREQNKKLDKAINVTMKKLKENLK